jgi:hypothetical protein
LLVLQVAKRQCEILNNALPFDASINNWQCGPGDLCERCLNCSQRPNFDCGFGYSSVKLVELTQYFIPTLLSHMHEEAQLTEFVSLYIRQWTSTKPQSP